MKKYVLEKLKQKTKAAEEIANEVWDVYSLPDEDYGKIAYEKWIRLNDVLEALTQLKRQVVVDGKSLQRKRENV